ncbi:hypothetical protein EZS27_012348 [termite gut metagenome]|uniref:Uncharacterized protein n=1 Tax=termite gut metagenome TaxID=433724 RepID=A0A5J4S2T7_9ZZZZ
MIVRTPDEIRSVLSALEDRGNMEEDISEYREGIILALQWVLGDIESEDLETPLSEI